MKNHPKVSRSSVINFCADIGKNPLLVQGAGGNVSWKDENILWIKASGTWLSDADQKDIFVPVDLTHILTETSRGNFSVIPQTTAPSQLRPSIETLMHALIPHSIVVHLHAVEILVYLVRRDFQAELKSKIDHSISWATVDYHKPGPDLSAAVYNAIKSTPSAQVVFLANHGIVIGGNDITEIIRILNTLTTSLTSTPKVYMDKLCTQHDHPTSSHQRVPERYSCIYQPIADNDIHLLVLNQSMFKQLEKNWALYPDHVVFLGAKPGIYDSWEIFDAAHDIKTYLPELIFIAQCGVFVKENFNLSKQTQLRCYYDVIIRQPDGLELNTLTDQQIMELIHWDAEKHRIALSK